MAAESPSTPQVGGMRRRVFFWFQRNGHRLLAVDIICIVLLFFMHLLASTFQVFTQDIAIIIQLAAIVPAAFIALSLIWKGVVPVIICVLGVVLMHNSVILPYYEPEPGQVEIEGRVFSWTYYTPTSVSVGSNMNFFLGLGMFSFSMIIAYRPTILFTRNRPESLENEWSKYPIWQDNTLLADGRTNRSVLVKSLMSDQDRYLLWRYEYILAVIYGTLHLARPNGLVPKDSTIMRDQETGRVLGKPRYTGFFM